MTAFKSALLAVGLSQQEAAAMLGVNHTTVKFWCNGRRGTPDFAWDMVKRMHRQQLTGDVRPEWPENARVMTEVHKILKTNGEK